MACDLAERHQRRVGRLHPHNMAVDDGKAAGVGLQELRRHVQSLGADFLRGDGRGIAGHHRGAGRMRADAIFDAVGLAVNDAHLRR